MKGIPMLAGGALKRVSIRNGIFHRKAAEYHPLESRKNAASVRGNPSSENLPPFNVAEFIHLRMFVSKETSPKEQTRMMALEDIHTLTGTLFHTMVRSLTEKSMKRSAHC
jgi:hypothetical protein